MMKSRKQNLSYKPFLRILSRGFLLEPGLLPKVSDFQQQDFTRAYDPVPVRWNGEVGSLYFWGYKSKKTPINRIASDLITHPGFDIRGTAIVVTKRERWHCIRCEGTEAEVRARISHVGLIEPERLVIKPSGRWETHRHIYVGNQDDAFAIRMVL